MQRTLMGMLIAALVALALAACSAQAGALSANQAPPGGKYRPVSALVPLPDFIPGLGTLYVQPDTLPLGPFLAYDRGGRLVGSLYMVPLDEMNDNKSWGAVEVGQAPADHVTIDFNPGHPGVPEAHYHVGVWYISPAEREALK